MKKYAIIGFGCAGYNAAKAIRMIDTDGVIDVYEKTVKPPFNPMLTTYYAGEKLNEDGYQAEEIAGKYDIILHELNIDYRNLEAKKPKTATLNEDGTITGSYTGSWFIEPGTPYIVLNIDGVNYSGVILKMNIENTNVETMVFTALGDTNQLTIWGSRSIEE